MKKYILFGAGNFGRMALEYYGEDNVECFVDNDKAKVGQMICGKKIISFDEYKDIADKYETVISSTYVVAMEKQLEENGISGYLYYSPSYENFIKNMKIHLGKNEVNGIVLYGVDGYTERLVSAIHTMGLKKKIKYIAVSDEDKKMIGKELCSYQICPFSDIQMSADCYIVSAVTNHAALYMQLRQRVENGFLIDPFKQTGYYETNEIIFNPYVMQKEDNTEEKWNESVENDKNREAIRAYVEAAQKDIQLFEYMEIETINRCNGVCSFCPVNKLVDTRPEIKMSVELFENIIGQLEEIGYSGELSLFSNNEPLLDERIIEFHKYARKHLPKARMHLFTNGTLFTVEIFKELIQYLDELIIDNYRQDLQLIRPCRDIKEYIEKTDPELRKKVTIVLRKPKEILTSRGGDAPNRQQMISYGEEKCALPFQQMVVRPDGKVSLCCNDSLGKCTLGDLTKQTILDVWYGSQFQMVRKCLAEGRKNWKHCEFCDTFYIY